MKNFYKLLLTVLVALLSSVSSFAYDFEVDGIYYNALSLQDLTCEVTYKVQYNATYSGDVVIPSTVTYSGRTFIVKTIGRDAFYNSPGLTSVVIPNSVTTIEEYAFMACKGLTSVEIPNSVTTIGSDAFSECTGLSSLEIPNSITTIGSGAFSYCTSLSSVEIPNSVTTIGSGAFHGCTGLTSVVIPNSVTTIGSSAFIACTGLTSVEIPNSVTTIGSSAFFGCSGLTSVVIPNSVTSIGEEAFSYCTGLTSVVIPKSVTEIESRTFRYCSGLTSVEIPNSVTDIEQEAFLKCTGLTSVVIPNSVIDIEISAFSGCEGLTNVVIGNSVHWISDEAFSECSSLSSVVIGKSVTSIGWEAFIECKDLKEITSLAVTPPIITENTFKEVSKTETIVKVPDESVEAYKAAKNWNLFWNIVGISSGEGGGSGETPETKVCGVPTIELVDGKIVAKSATEGAKCYTSIKTDDYKGYDGTEAIELSGVYEISSYAHAEGYQNSETVTATLVWVNPTIAGGEDIFNMEAKKAVVISAIPNGIRVSGTSRGEMISVYSIDGGLIKNATADDGETKIECPQGIVLVKIGDKSVKVNVKF